MLSRIGISRVEVSNLAASWAVLPRNAIARLQERRSSGYSGNLGTLPSFEYMHHHAIV
jgi:hypothetical protein